MRPSTPLRVALFAEQGHPEGSFRSGVTRLTDRFAEACRRRGDVTVDFFTYHQRSGCDAGWPVRYHRIVPRVPVSFHGLQVDALDIAPIPNPRVAEAAGSGTYDVVLGTSPGIGTQGQLFARARGLPFVALYTTDLPNYAEQLVSRGIGPLMPAGRAGALARRSAWRYLRWLYGRARTELVLLPTQAARDDFLREVDAEAAVLGRGADTLTFPWTDRSHAGPVRLLYVGRVDYGQKNLAVLEAVVRTVPGSVLWIVGEGDDRELMARRLAPEVAAGRVVFAGRIDDPRILARRYLEADVFVFPSIYDTLGQVVLEAQRAGLPVVVRDRGGPRELVRDGTTGFVTNDDEAFVRCVADLVTSEKLRLRMGRAAKLHADAMPTWAQVTDDLVDRLQRLVREA